MLMLRNYSYPNDCHIEYSELECSYYHECEKIIKNEVIISKILQILKMGI